METLWRQKSRELWLKEGDKNSKFFHASTISNMRRIFIPAIKDDGGNWKVSRHDIGKCFTDQFELLFRFDNVEQCPHLDDFIQPVISEHENEMFLAIPSCEEVFEVVRKMNPIKSPGPDGLPARFFQKYWCTVGRDVVQLVQNAFCYGIIPRSVNDTSIVLIPKVLHVSVFKHPRPISLCNTIYKIVSKIIAMRIRPFLDRIVYPTQSAFVLGWWIRENLILSNEIVHTMKMMKDDKGLVGIKIDMNRAYDRVEWNVLNGLLANYGFSSWAFALISECYMVDSSAQLFNGSVFDRVKVERGLRQEDPISPYLFILMSELLSRMLLKLESEGKIQGVRFGRTGPAISHLFFADDILIFFRANKENVDVINDCLEQYCGWTGQAINVEKSGCFFSRNTRGRTKALVKQILNLREIRNDAKYLGNPFFVGRNKASLFEDLQSRVEARILGWKAKLLSCAGCATLVKTVLSTILSYSMASCKLPLCDVVMWTRWLGNSFGWVISNRVRFFAPIS